MGDMINAYIILFQTPEGESLFVIYRRTWENNIKIDSREIAVCMRMWTEFIWFKIGSIDEVL
jgi:hypothetical protein